MQTVNVVERVRLEAAGVEQGVDEMRRLLRERGRAQAAWTVVPSATPPDLEARLRELGMTAYDDPPIEPSHACMALVHAPAGDTVERVVARRITTLEEMLMASSVELEVMGLGEAEREAERARLRRRFEASQDERSPWRDYIAFSDGEAVGAARACCMAAGMNLAGGAVLPAARGQGVYRALVEARWQEAVARGTPALTVQAGRMSRPILERLGFTTISEASILCDRFA